eukprot:119872-Pelagomonas_calceolata.AAC.1
MRKRLWGTVRCKLSLSKPFQRRTLCLPVRRPVFACNDCTSCWGCGHDWASQCVWAFACQPEGRSQPSL